MISKMKRIVSQLFSKSKLLKESEKDLKYLQPWIILEITDPHESNQESGRILKSQQ